MFRPGLALPVLTIVVVIGFFVWGLMAMNRHVTSSWTGGSWVLAAIMVAGVIAVGAVAAVFMALAFYSSRHGYDDTQGVSDPDAD